MGLLDGKVIIVTGGASGIGAGSTEVFAAEGARVVVADINQEGAERQAARVRNAGGDALALGLDLADESTIKAMIADTQSAYGGLDVLFNNAANTRLVVERDTAVEDLDVDVWDEVMRVSLRGTMLATKHAIPALRARGGGSIINIASGAGQAGAHSFSSYGVAKAGVIMLSQYVAVQHGKEGIRCNAIAPGLIVTPAVDGTYDEGAGHAMMLRHHLTPRLGLPQDIAYAAVYLASDRAEFVTGQCFNIDGGCMAHQAFWADAIEAGQ